MRCLLILCVIVVVHSSVKAYEFPPKNAENTEKVSDGEQSFQSNPDIRTLQNSMNDLLYSMKLLETKLTDVQDDYKRLEDKYNFLDGLARINNLVFFNVEETENEKRNSIEIKVLNIITKLMRVRISTKDIVLATRIGNKIGPRPIVVKFVHFKKKLEVFQARSRLKVVHIDVSEDFSEHVRNVRKELMPFLRSAWALGHHAYLRYDKIIMYGQEMSLEELEKEDEFESPREEEADIEPKMDSGSEIDMVPVDPEHRDDYFDYKGDGAEDEEYISHWTVTDY